MQNLFRFVTAPRLLLTARLLGALAALGNLLLAGVCLTLLVHGDWLGLALGLALLLPLLAWFVALRGPLVGARAFAITFLALWALWTINEMLPCSSGHCNLYGFLVVALPNFAASSTLSLLLSAFLFYAAYRLQSRPAS